MTLPFRFDVPTQFTPLDLASSPEDRIERTTRRMAEVWPDSTEGQRDAITSTQELLIERLRSNGVRYAATVLEPAVPTTGLFTVSLHRVDIADPLTPLADALRPHAEVHDLDTRLGRMLAIGHHRDGVRQMQVALPLPHRKTMALFGISTEHLSEWETYTLHLVNVVGTVRPG
ncbi:hypothetical protein BDK92_6304 [Micromonospora pisi]|uniref:Uncharacterized protein n=1 Tax=Micromonospora pisi TaxID=589240 RepID=A0A495JSB6_9ACTN|nr:hypothetical protein [Micromonospora pisi]RKR91876.1 hypothetical protein BDK92_6304 [Micromonospora pisi]